MSERDKAVRELAEAIAAESSLDPDSHRYQAKIQRWGRKIHALLVEQEARLVEAHLEAVDHFRSGRNHALGELSRLRGAVEYAASYLKASLETYEHRGGNAQAVEPHGARRILQQHEEALAASPLSERMGKILATVKLTVRAWRELNEGSEPTKWRAELERGCLPQLAAELDALRAAPAREGSEG